MKSEILQAAGPGSTISSLWPILLIFILILIAVGIQLIKKNIVENKTVDKKKILIIWIAINVFALLTNIAPIKGQIKLDSPNTYYIFTNAEYQRNNGFWPFVDFTENYVSYNYYGGTDIVIFRGIFYNYNFLAFITYSTLGVLIFFFRRIWNSSK